MTREEILAMQPGREMDLLVAEKVMNWEFGEDFIELNGGLNRGGKWFNPSTDIAAAIDVAEKFGSWQLTKAGMVNINREYRAIIDKNKNVAYADTAPLAICRAALLAVMNE